MRLRILFVKYEDDLMPNALVVTDDYMEDEHGRIPDFYKEECDKARALSPDAEYAEAVVTISDASVEKLFQPATISALRVDSVTEVAQ